MCDLPSAPLLSTPDTHIFEDVTPVVVPGRSFTLTDEQLRTQYEIEKTVREILRGGWTRIALQFPDHMLPDAPWISRTLRHGLDQASTADSAAAGGYDANSETHPRSFVNKVSKYTSEAPARSQWQLFILADTSYGACCVDEVAAEHADAQAIVHYGRTCMSPTARLPVLYCYTYPPLDVSSVVRSFIKLFPATESPVILMADVPYCNHLDAIHTQLEGLGYSRTFIASLIHDASSPVPNRTIPQDVIEDTKKLGEWHLFHIADPPKPLLLTLSSQVASLHILPIEPDGKGSSIPLESSASSALRRRYALLTSLTTVPIWGILVNTLSVKDYMKILALVKDMIAKAGKKSYTFVVGKVNAAKVANFSEVGGWVVIGCWESSLFDSKDFWRPVITPFELRLALQQDSERIWTGEWSSDYQVILRQGEKASSTHNAEENATDKRPINCREENDSDNPVFNLRTGKYVSSSRPMAMSAAQASLPSNHDQGISSALTRLEANALVTIGGEISPAAEFFKNQRTWQGLGSDFEASEGEDGAVHGAAMEQGRRGIARGYVVDEDKRQR